VPSSSPFVLIVSPGPDGDGGDSDAASRGARMSGFEAREVRTVELAVEHVTSRKLAPTAALLDGRLAAHAEALSRRLPGVPIILVADDDEPQLHRRDLLRCPRSVRGVQRALAQALPRARILVADDDAVLRELMKELLDESGFEVVVARNGHDVQLLLEREPFDLVLLDLRMPRVDGWQVLAWIRTQRGLKGLPVVILSATELDERTRRAMNHELPFAVRKPLEPAELLALIRKHLAAARTLEAAPPRVAKAGGA
jgi:CheY-like chemotaxis protein